MKTKEAREKFLTLEDKIVAFIQNSEDKLFTVKEIMTQIKRSRERAEALLGKLREEGRLSSIGRGGGGGIKFWGLPDRVWEIAEEWGRTNCYEGVKIESSQK